MTASLVQSVLHTISLWYNYKTAQNSRSTSLNHRKRAKLRYEMQEILLL